MSIENASLVVVYTVYGLSFIVMAVVLQVWLERTAKLGIAGQLPWLSAFAGVHGVSDLIDAALRTPGVNASPMGPLAAVRLVLLAGSFVLLLWFGLSVLLDNPVVMRVLRAFLGLSVLGIAAGITALYASGASEQTLRSAEMAARLYLGLPGGIAAAVGFWRVQRKCSLLGLHECELGARIAAVGIGAYAIFAGAFATGYPSAYFLAGFPIQIHRMIAAIVATTGCILMLHRLRVQQ